MPATLSPQPHQQVKNCFAHIVPHDGSRCQGVVRDHRRAEAKAENITQAGRQDFSASQRTDWQSYLFLQPQAHPVENRRDAACAAPLRIILNISCRGLFHLEGRTVATAMAKLLMGMVWR